MKGELARMTPEYMIECYKCDNLDSTPGYSINEVKPYFRQKGWRKRKGFWFCPKCAVKGYGLNIKWRKQDGCVT